MDEGDNKKREGDGDEEKIKDRKVWRGEKKEGRGCMRNDV
jgi:hypothetical protein